MRLTVLDPLSRGNEHSEFNRGYLRAFSETCDNRKVKFVADQSHLAAVLGDDSLNAAIDARPESFQLQKGAQSLWRNTLRFIRVMRHHTARDSNLVVLSCNNSLLVCLKLAAFIARRPATVMLHGFIDDLNQPRSSRAYRLVRFTLTSLNGATGFQYVVISGHIVESIGDVLPDFVRRVHLLTAPMPTGRAAPENGSPNSPLKLGSAGVFSEKKGAHQFIDLTDRLPPDDYRLYYIGRVPREWKVRFEARRDRCIFVEDPTDQVFASYFGQLDFVLFFYPRHTYRFGLSGVFLEAIKHGKPIIAIRNRMFEYYFERFGQLGWLFDDYAGLEQFIRTELRNMSQPLLRAIAANCEALRREFSPEATARQLSAILDE